MAGRKGLSTSVPIEDRFFARVEKDPGGCWIWTGGHRKGYGRIMEAGVVYPAHRWAYERWVADIPEGLLLDHFVCDTTLCVNPLHVRPATHRENVLRSATSPSAVNARRTHCKHGHEFTPENTGWLIPARGEPKRRCKRCNSISNARRQRDQRAVARAARAA